ncbi:MAG: hypothetical protein Q4G25_12650 [Paracoccus sp. (in: a-proteobacteria)]|nr:hypothetical protein [Paracoccus sp. (in: a-proteobacteria)]
MEHFPADLPGDLATVIGTMVSHLQWTRFQDHIQRDIDAGATRSAADAFNRPYSARSA